MLSKIIFSMVFTCTVRVYIDSSELPADCSASRRRREITRREVQAPNSGKKISIDFYKAFWRDFFSFILVSVTLNIEKEEKQGDIDESENETGSAALTCTNFALGLFLGAFTLF